MENDIPTEVLKFARESAGIRQSELAKRLAVSPSVLSRLEKAETANAQFAIQYLDAIDTPLSGEVLEFYDRPWGDMPPPSFLHPNKDQLWSIADALQSLSVFEAGPDNVPVLRRSLALLKEDLNAALNYLSRRDHTIAWLGDIGVGKTTALAFATSILVPDAKGAFRPVFPTGAGRTTVCEVVIKSAPVFGVAVEAMSEDDIRSATRDLVLGLKDAPYGVPAELARVLRNMAGVRTSRTMVDGQYSIFDPVSKLLEEEPDTEKVVDRLLTAMDLPSRNETQLILSAENENGQEWLASTISKINNGLHERFSVPRRVTVLLPSKVLAEGGTVLSIVDTKGIESVTQREDLRAHMDDPRTLVVMCAKFPDAPGPTAQRILREDEQAGSNAAKKGRVCLLVLPRADEAMQVTGDGEAVADAEEGMVIRREEIRQALQSASLPAIPTLFFNALEDGPERIWKELKAQVDRLRQPHVDRLEQTIRGVSRLIGNVNLAKSEAARAQVEEDADRLLSLINDLPPIRRHAHENLMDQFDIAHQSSIAASINRRGDWGNFPVLHILGFGVRNDANIRVSQRFDQIEHSLANWRLEHHHVPDVVQDLEALSQRADGWRQNFLATAQSIGRDGFRDALEQDASLWRETAERYGQGSGYKKDLAFAFKAFFERDALDVPRNKIESRLTEAWKQCVLEPFRETTRAVYAAVVTSD